MEQYRFCRSAGVEEQWTNVSFKTAVSRTWLNMESWILADRGFDISEDLGLYGARLEIPAFTRGKKQLSLREVEYLKRLSKVRIHIAHDRFIEKQVHTTSEHPSCQYDQAQG